MIQVVPAILEQEWSAVQKKARQIKRYTSFIQLDVMDGQFVPNITFMDTAKLATLDLQMELHMMVERPALQLQKWMLPNVTRIIVHFEAEGNLAEVIELIRKGGKEVGVAINPDTSTHELRPYLDQIDLALVMGVTPGFSGQAFNRDVLEKIKELKKLKPELLVEVDGGVNLKTRDQIVGAGADILAAASAIWEAEDIGQAIAALQGEPG